MNDVVEWFDYDEDGLSGWSNSQIRACRVALGILRLVRVLLVELSAGLRA